LDRHRNVIRLRGERFGHEVVGGDYIGVAALGSRVVASLPDEGCLIGDVALPRLRAGLAVRTVLYTTGWSDMGDLPSYLGSNMKWLADHGAGPSYRGPGAWVGPGVTLEQCVVGAGAHVDGTGRVSRSVVWPGARVSAPFSNAIAHGQGHVVGVD
jgi:mannose-1-phosphate guanylyltransferase